MAKTEGEGSLIPGSIIVGVVIVLLASDIVLEQTSRPGAELLSFSPYLLPLLPLFLRLLMLVPYKDQMRGELTSEAQEDRDVHRSVVLGLMGFSFSGTVALFVVNAKVELNLLQPAYFLLVSFLSYFSVLNIQQYKFRRWHDNLGDGFLESGHFALMLSISSLVWRSEAPTTYRYVVASLPVMVSLADFTIRIGIKWKFFHRLKTQKMRRKVMTDNEENESLDISDEKIKTRISGYEEVELDLNFRHCSIHGISYPKGERCPLC